MDSLSYFLRPFLVLLFVAIFVRFFLYPSFYSKKFVESISLQAIDYVQSDYEVNSM